MQCKTLLTICCDRPCAWAAGISRPWSPSLPAPPGSPSSIRKVSQFPSPHLVVVVLRCCCCCCCCFCFCFCCCFCCCRRRRRRRCCCCCCCFVLLLLLLLLFCCCCCFVDVVVFVVFVVVFYCCFYCCYWCWCCFSLLLTLSFFLLNSTFSFSFLLVSLFVALWFSNFVFVVLFPFFVLVFLPYWVAKGQKLHRISRILLSCLQNFYEETTIKNYKNINFHRFGSFCSWIFIGRILHYKNRAEMECQNSEEVVFSAKIHPRGKCTTKRFCPFKGTVL